MAVFCAKIVEWVCNILIIILIARSLLSWFVYSGNPYSSRNIQIRRIYQILTALTEPIVGPIRRLISRYVNTGPVDLAPMAAFFIILLVGRLLTSILYGLA